MRIPGVGLRINGPRARNFIEAVTSQRILIATRAEHSAEKTDTPQRGNAELDWTQPTAEDYAFHAKPRILAYLDLTTCPLLTLDDVASLMRVEELARGAIFHHWLKPCAQFSEMGGSSHPLFTRRDVDALIARIVAGEVPPPLPKNATEPT